MDHARHQNKGKRSSAASRQGNQFHSTIRSWMYQASARAASYANIARFIGKPQ
jgi:hypothetical protein